MLEANGFVHNLLTRYVLRCRVFEKRLHTLIRETVRRCKAKEGDKEIDMDAYVLGLLISFININVCNRRMERA